MDVLEEIERRVLWLAVRMVDYANRERPKRDDIKVGGHQASSASMVSIMTALWFGALDRDDRVAVKPHASPVFHAIQYLLGNLDRERLLQLRAFGGLQAYPSRTKDPDPVDYSTGSVGLGAAAPLFGAAVARYVHRRFGGPQPGRYIALMGDAELDEGNVWEAIADPAVQGLGNVLWVVDLNRQSLDRVVPGIKAASLQSMFVDNGWHVLEAKYGRRLEAAFRRRGGEALRRCIDDMPNEQYQSLFAFRGAELRDHFLAAADPEVKRVIADVPDAELHLLLHNLGGHDLPLLLDRFAAAAAEPERPSVLFAYTIKGWGLPIAGDPLNHAAQLSEGQIDALRAELGVELGREWDGFDPESDAGRLCQQVGDRLRRPERRAAPPVVPVPREVGLVVNKPISTQEAFGRLVVGLGRVDGVADRLVTTSPDVTVSTNLGGWVNKVGVFAPEELHDYLGDDRLLRWRQGPTGQHIELGISEMNLFLLLGQLGLAQELCGELLLPIGTVYDPFVLRGLDAFIYGTYSGAGFIVVGTPSGVTLSYEGGAHQSIVTPSVGMELPGVVFAEPASARALDWLLCDGLARLCDPERREALYLRLTTRPLDQAPFDAAYDRLGAEEMRRQTLEGGYRLVDATADAGRDVPGVFLAGSGAVMPEVVAAGAVLASEGVAATVLDVTSLDRLYRGWIGARRRDVETARVTPDRHHLASLIPPARRRDPIVTVHDAAPHAMSWLGSVFGAPVVPLGVTGFGQSGAIDDLYRSQALDAASIVNAALLAVERAPI